MLFVDHIAEQVKAVVAQDLMDVVQVVATDMEIEVVEKNMKEGQVVKYI